MQIGIVRSYLLLTVFCSTIAVAQQKILFEHLSVPDGLSSNNISGVCQDDYGYLWIATADGLNRYDGYNFEVFKSDPSDTLSLPASNITAVYKDNQGIIWVASTDGISERNPATGQFRNYAPSSSAVSERYVIRIFEDSQKRYWIGFRFRGLFLFDKKSKSFTRMKVESRGAIQEYGGPVLAIIETASGAIYSASTGDGFLKYNEQRQIFEIVDVGTEWKSYFQNTFVWDIHEDKSGNLWITTNDFLFKFNPVQNTMQKVDLNFAGSKPSRYKSMYEDKEGFLWIGSDAGIFRYNLRSSELFRHQRDNRRANSLSNQDVWTLFEDSFGVLWIGTIGGGLNKYDRSKIPFDKYTEFAEETEGTNTSATSAIAPDYRDRDAMWIGTDTGLWHINRKQNVNTYIELPKDIGKDRVNALLADEEGILWIGTTNHGLIKYDIQQDKFSIYSSNIYNSEGLRSGYIYDIEQDDYGDLWIATTYGLYRLDPKSNAISRVPSFESREYSADLLSYIHSVHKSKPLAAILEVADFANETEEFSIGEKTDVAIVSVGEGLLVWDMVDYGWLENEKGDTLWSGGHINQTFHLSGSMKNRIRASILSLDPGKYKLRFKSDDSHAYAKWNDSAPLDSAWWGIQIIPVSSEEAENISTRIKNEEQKSSIEGLRIFELHYSRNGELWIGSERGLSRYDPKSGKVINYIHNPNNPSALSDEEVDDIFEDRNGIFWIATPRGLNRFDPKTETFQVFHEKDGLPSDQIRAIAEDEEGNLWLSSINGITRFEKKSDSDRPLFINYDVQDGLQGYEFFSNSVYQYEDGELIFGGRNGFNAFYPGSVSHSAPRVVLSDFSISNQVIRPGDEDSIIDKVIMDVDKIELNHDQNDLSFAFSTLHYSRPAKNTVFYRLEGYQNEWISDNRRFVSFTNLDPGEYRFRVKGISGDGIPAKEEVNLAIAITPPWWTTTWAYILYGLLFIAGVFAVDRIQRYRLTLRERNRTQIREAELRAQAAEADARALQIEHERKTHELEEARNLQLSLLPAKLPELPNLEIAVYMKTATEVGGDYYDFNISVDGTLNIALGDATGHGMRAGTMVTLMKGLFSADSGKMDIDDFFRQSSDTIKDLQFGRVMMALTRIKIKENRMLFSSAGMPPAYVYRPSTLKVDELSLSGMPLGAMKEFDYKVIQEDLEKGDTMLLLSDGLPELKNPNGETFDYPRVEKIFRDVADETPQTIIDRLVDAGEIWRKDTLPDDDVTLMVIKAR